MKYLCNSCKKSFTTIASDQKTKDQFTLYLKDLRCFHCRSRDIELHDDCKGRICGEETVCDGCYSFFNCWTGNIDDGIIIEKDKQAEIESAKEKVKHIEKREAREQFENIHHRLDKKGFKYYIKYGARYIQILGTIWKLKDEDWNSIIAKEWNTSQSKAVKKNIEKKGISLDLVSQYFELMIKLNQIEKQCKI